MNFLNKKQSNDFAKPILLVCLIVFMLFLSCKKGAKPENEAITSLQTYRELRQEKLNQPRPVIHNNDGCDAYLFPSDREFSLTNFLDYRSVGLKGTDVSTISYCTIASSLGNLRITLKLVSFLHCNITGPAKRISLLNLSSWEPTRWK